MKTITKGKCMLIGAVILLILFLFPQAVKAEETWQVGESAYARLNGSVLEIYGTGDMWDADASNHYVSGHGDSFPAGGKIPYISESFTEIRIGDGITGIGSYAFSGGASHGVTLTVSGTGITYVGDRAFGSTLRQILSNTAFPVKLAGSLQEIGKGAFLNNPFTGGLSLPKVTKIGSSAFGSGLSGGNTFSHVTLGDNTNETTLGTAIFTGCTSSSSSLTYQIKKNHTTGSAPFSGAFKSIVVDERTETLDDYTFAKTIAERIEIPENAAITRLGNYVFQDCSALRQPLVIPKNVTRYGVGILSGCERFANLDYYPTRATSSGSLGNPGSLPSGFRITVKKSVEKVPDLFAYGCTNLTYAGFETTGGDAALTTIGNSAFKGCTNLTRAITTSSDMNFYTLSHFTTIEDSAFENCSLDNAALIVPFNAPAITTIGEDAFRNNPFSGVSIPSTVTAIGSKAFGDCNNLTGIAIADDIPSSAFLSPDVFYVSGNYDYDFDADGTADLLETYLNTNNETAKAYCWRSENRRYVPGEPVIAPVTGDLVIQITLQATDHMSTPDPVPDPEPTPNPGTDPEPTPEPETEKETESKPAPEEKPRNPLPEPVITPDNPLVVDLPEENQSQRKQKLAADIVEEPVAEELLQEPGGEAAVLEEKKIIPNKPAKTERAPANTPKKPAIPDFIPPVVAALLAGVAVVALVTTGALQYLWLLILMALFRDKKQTWHGILTKEENRFIGFHVKEDTESRTVQEIIDEVADPGEILKTLLSCGEETLLPINTRMQIEALEGERKIEINKRADEADLYMLLKEMEGMGDVNVTIFHKAAKIRIGLIYRL